MMNKTCFLAHVPQTCFELFCHKLSKKNVLQKKNYNVCTKKQLQISCNSNNFFCFIQNPSTTNKQPPPNSHVVIAMSTGTVVYNKHKQKYIATYLPPYPPTCLLTYQPSVLPSYLQIYIPTYIYLRMQPFKYIRLHFLQPLSYILLFLHTFTYICNHLCKFTHVSMHVQTYTYIYIQVEPGKPGAEVSKGKNIIRQRKNVPIECAHGAQPIPCPNRGFCVHQPSAVHGGGVLVVAGCVSLVRRWW